MPLLSLPNELLLCIGEALPPKNLHIFLRTNRRLCTLLTPLLHQLSIKDRGGLHPLQWAAMYNRPTLTKTLLSRGADITAQDGHGWTALHYAVLGGHTEIAKHHLRIHPALVSARTTNGEIALHWAAKNVNPDLIDTLLAYGSDVSAVDVYGETPLHVAAKFGCAGAVERLVAAGAVVDARDENDQTPLMFAARCGLVKAVKALIGLRADVNGFDANGNTPLLCAVRWGCMWSAGCVGVLVDAGAAVEIRGRDGLMPVEWARRLEREGVVDRILEGPMDVV